MNKYLNFKYGMNYDVEKIEKTVEDLQEFGCTRTEDVNELEDYISSLRSKIYIQLLNMKCDEDFEDFALSNIAELYEELSKFDDVKIYRSSKVDLYELNNSFERAFYNRNFYEFINLVKGINAYFKISNPSKPSNKIAFGWNEGSKRTESERYLYVCIRNYLSENKVEFDTKDLQSIVFGRF